MKLLCLGDLHLTDNKPVNRTDNYWETCKNKLHWILDTANDECVDAIIAPGDLTDTPSLSNLELKELIRIFKEKLTMNIYLTWGQHDLRFRTKPQTALSVLREAIDKFVILDKDSEYSISQKEKVIFYGSEYGSEVPKPMDYPGYFTVLIIHRMIIEEKLWSAQEIYEPSNLFLRQNNFDLIVSGDNHHSFMCQTPGKRFLINNGAMMRNKIDMVDHKPYVIIFDTNTKTYKQIFIPIEPAEKVFRMEKVVVEKERNENLESFVEGLSQQKEVGLLFEDNLREYEKENNIEQEVSLEIRESFRKEK